MEALAGLEPHALSSLDDLEVGVAWLGHAEAAVRERVAAAAGLMPRARAVELPLPEGVFPAFQHEIAAVHRDLFAEHRERYGPNVRTKIGLAIAVSEAEAAQAREARERYREEFGAALDGFDLVIAPTLPIPPPPVGVDELEVRDRMTQLTFPLNAVGAPALALPCGRTEDGLPVSLQLFARPGDDALVLAAAALLETALRHTARSGRSRTEGA